MHGGISIHISTPSYGISSEERISLRPIIVPLLYSILDAILLFRASTIIENLLRAQGVLSGFFYAATVIFILVCFATDELHSNKYNYTAMYASTIVAAVVL